MHSAMENVSLHLNSTIKGRLVPTGGFFTCSLEGIHTAYQECLNGHPSSCPVIEMTIPSSLDSTIAPPGKTGVNAFLSLT